MNRRSLVTAAVTTPMALKARAGKKKEAALPVASPDASPIATPSVDAWAFKVSGFEFAKLDQSTLIYNRPILVKVRTDDLVDKFGVPMRKEADGTLVDQAVTQAQYLLRMLSNHNFTGKEKYLELAETIGQRLYETRHEIDGAYFFPYTFDYTLSGKPSDELEAPWYSGMAQGQVLQCFVRLWHATGDDKWIRYAESTVASFLKINDPSRPGVMRTNERYELWIEEYPESTYLETLNGHIFGYLGLYDYWLVTEDGTIRQLIDGALTTVLNTVDSRFRNPGQPSHYAMHQPSQPEGYHVIHMAQILESYRITQDPRFAELALSLHMDYPPYGVTGEIELRAGPYIIFQEDRVKPHLVLGNSSLKKLETTTTIKVHQRRRLWNEERYYYRYMNIDGDPRWIRESEDVRLSGELTGTYSSYGPLWGTRMEFDPPVTFTGNPVEIAEPVAAIAIVNGRHQYLVDGSGSWQVLPTEDGDW